MQKYSLCSLMLLLCWLGMISLLPAQQPVFHWGDNEPIYTCGSYGNHLYLGGHYNGLYIARMGSYGSVDSLILKTEFPNLYKLSVFGNLLCGINSDNIMILASVSDPENPQVLSQTYISQPIKQITWRGNIVVLVSAHYVFLYDIAIPAAPVLAYQFYYTSQHAWNDAAIGRGILFISGDDGRLTLYDITNPYAPQFISQEDHTTADFEYLFLNTVYVLCVRLDGRISVYDLNDPAVHDFLFLQGSPNQQATVCAKPLFYDRRFLFIPTINDTIYVHDMLTEHPPMDVHKLKMNYHISSLLEYENFLVVTHLPGGFSIYRMPAYTDAHDNVVPAESEIRIFPNPFRNETSILFSSARAGNISLNIYNSKGQKVKSQTQSPADNGLYTLHWDGTNESGQHCPNGLYFIKTSNCGQIRTAKVLLIK